VARKTARSTAFIILLGLFAEDALFQFDDAQLELRPQAAGLEAGNPFRA